jgi:hypothetical protein
MTLSERLSPITSRPYWWLYALGIAILLVSAWLWWTMVHLSPERVFWGMVENSLSTRGVTIETTQSSEQSKARQLVQMELGPTGRAHSLTTLVQGNTEINTEIIGTRDADYTRYRAIKTDQKNAAGKPLDISKVLNLWSRSDDIAQSATQSSGHQLLAQAVLGIGLPVGAVPVPIGEVTPKQRQNMLQQIRDQGVYEITFGDAKKERKDGRLLYTYDVKIQTILYVRLMKDFAKNLGLSELDQVDPNSYQSAQPLEVKLTVDAHSRQLVGVDNGMAGYKQAYSGYGLPINVDLPKDPISSSELQQRLTEL